MHSTIQDGFHPRDRHPVGRYRASQLLFRHPYTTAAQSDATENLGVLCSKSITQRTVPMCSLQRVLFSTLCAPLLPIVQRRSLECRAAPDRSRLLTRIGYNTGDALPSTQRTVPLCSQSDATENPGVLCSKSITQRTVPMCSRTTVYREGMA